nr:MAG TPA: capsid protein [Bacteriophage sp.]
MICSYVPLLSHPSFIPKKGYHKPGYTFSLPPRPVLI